MSIQALRKELFWTRTILIILFLLILLIDREIHDDYSKFLDTKEWMKTAEIEKIIDDTYENDRLTFRANYIETSSIIPE